MGTIVTAPGAGFEPAVRRLTGARVAASPPWYLSLSTDSNGPLPGTGRARRHLRLRGSARRPSHRTAADLQTCDTRSASALCSGVAREVVALVPCRQLPAFEAGALRNVGPLRGAIY